MHHETMEAFDIVIHLKELLDKYARSERFEISKLLFSTKMQVGTSPMQRALKIGHFPHPQLLMHLIVIRMRIRSI